ncbi:hypothetical protein A2U01_0111825, partial [Trifolium medium]|nr:hypothetical protein [Trifolium medium]
TSLLDDGKKDSEEKDAEVEGGQNKKEGLSGDNHSEDRPERSGQDVPAIVKPSGETQVVGEVQDSGVVAEG